MIDSYELKTQTGYHLNIGIIFLWSSIILTIWTQTFWTSHWGDKINMWPIISDKLRTEILVKFGYPYLLGSLVSPVFQRFYTYAYLNHIYPLLKLEVIYNKYCDMTHFVYPCIGNILWSDMALYKEDQVKGFIPWVTN